MKARVDNALVFTIPFAVASSKNSKGIRRTGKRCPLCKQPRGTPILYRKAEIVEQTETIKRIALEAIKVQGFRPVDDEDVELIVNYQPERDCVLVLVRESRRRLARTRTGNVKGRTGRRRDVHNMLELIADALNLVAYRDDRQISYASARRVLDADEIVGNVASSAPRTSPAQGDPGSSPQS